MKNLTNSKFSSTFLDFLSKQTEASIQLNAYRGNFSFLLFSYVSKTAQKHKIQNSPPFPAYSRQSNKNLHAGDP